MVRHIRSNAILCKKQLTMVASVTSLQEDTNFVFKFSVFRVMEFLNSLIASVIGPCLSLSRYYFAEGNERDSASSWLTAHYSICLLIFHRLHYTHVTMICLSYFWQTSLSGLTKNRRVAGNVTPFENSTDTRKTRKLCHEINNHLVFGRFWNGFAFFVKLEG